jgi:hypothetical protein
MDKIEKLVMKIVNGESTTTEDLQLYVNHADKIERLLDKIRKGVPNGKAAPR